MVTTDLGAITAYAEAVAGGYTGTKEEFEESLAAVFTVLQNTSASNVFATAVITS